MAIVTDTTQMTGAAMRQIKYADLDGDAYDRATQLAAVAYNLLHHRHIPGEGNLIPLEGLEGGALKRGWFFAGLGGG